MTDSKKPNLLYIVADQWRGDCLGLYGNAHPVMTPHLNQLASEGVNFTRAYAGCPICMPQRVTMLTGQTGSQLRCLGNFGRNGMPVFDRSMTLPARLAREAGYQTKAVGKMHFMLGSCSGRHRKRQAQSTRTSSTSTTVLGGRRSSLTRNRIRMTRSTSWPTRLTPAMPAG